MGIDDDPDDGRPEPFYSRSEHHLEILRAWAYGHVG